MAWKRKKYVRNDTNYIRYKTCTRKKPYFLKSKAMKTIERFHGINNPEFHVYECPFCYSYHIGHKTKHHLECT